MTPARALAGLGRPVLVSLASLGRIAIYGARTMAATFRAPFYPREFLSALMQVGWLSLPVVGLTAVGRVTVVKLELNRERALRIRETDLALERHPPDSDRRQ